MENILFDKKVRSKNKSFWDYFSLSSYYEKENISFKEKVYTYLYNMERTGFTTKGELAWCKRMLEMDANQFIKIEAEFKKDYREFAMDVKNDE